MRETERPKYSGDESKLELTNPDALFNTHKHSAREEGGTDESSMLMLMESLLMEHIFYTEMNEGNRQETPQYIGIWN